MANNLIFEQQSQAMAANYEWKIMMAGDFLRITDSTYPVTVSLIKGNRIIGSMSNYKAGDFVRDIDYDGVVIKNGANAQTVTLQIAGGGAGSDRVVGEVSIINGEISRVINGQCFMASIGRTAAAGQYPHAYLYNLNSNTKSLSVSKISFYANDLGMAVGIGWIGAQPGGAAGSYTNKKIGAPAPIAWILGQDLGVNTGNYFASVSCDVAYKTIEFQFSEPLLVGPGYGLVVSPSKTGVLFNVNWQWTEQ